MERSLLKKGLIHLPTLLTGKLTNNHMLIMFLIVLNTNQQTAVRESVNCWTNNSLFSHIWMELTDQTRDNLQSQMGPI